MLPYWSLFAIFALAALTERNQSPREQRITVPMIFLFLVMALMIGLRFQVGADYLAYEYIFEFAASSKLLEVIDGSDPGYQFVNWLVGQWDGKMWQVNLICGALFSWGLARFCRQQPSPMLAGLVAIPYLVIVVAMGYTRQAVAIGIIMAGLASLDRHGSILRFVIYVSFAALFHRTAVIVLPLAIFAGRRNNVLNVVAVLVAGFGLYSALLEESVDTLVKNYIEARYGSQGAAIRVAMSVLPAALLLLYGRRLGFTDSQLRLWRLIAVVALACVPALFLVPSTTAVDRIALYLIPIQLVVFGRLPVLLTNDSMARVLVLAYAFSILFIWLNFAAHAFAWVPYRTVIS